MEALCTPAACWTAPKTSREDMQILGPASTLIFLSYYEPPDSSTCSSSFTFVPSGHEGRLGAVRGALQFATSVQRHISGLESASYVATGTYGTFELTLHAHGRSSTPSFLLRCQFCDALDLPQGAYLNFPRPSKWETAAYRYRTLFAAHVIQPQDILLRLQNQRIYITTHVQQYLVGLDAEYEDRLSMWTLGVRSALEALPSFSTAMAATPERMDRTLENDPLHTGPTEQGGAARNAAERRHAAGSRGASACAYCGRALEKPTGDSAVKSLWALIPCPHGEQVDARRMLDRAERLAGGHANPQPCVARHSE